MAQSPRYVVASDHAGLELKNHMRRLLEDRGNAVDDLGTHGPESVDYPDFAADLGRKIVAGEAELGVLVCGTGIGASIAVNKIRGIRGALCRTEYEARMARRHNDANVLVLGGRITAPDLAEAILDAWAASDFEGGRHQRRIDKISELEKGANDR